MIVPATVVLTWGEVAVSPAVLAAFAVLGIAASRVSFDGFPNGRNRYSPACLVLLAAGLVGGPTVGVVAGLAGAPRVGVRRGDLFWASEAALLGCVVGVVSLAAWPLPLRVCVAVGGGALVTMSALAAVYWARGLGGFRELSSQARLVFGEAVLAVPLLLVLAESYPRSPLAVLGVLASVIVVMWLAQSGRARYRAAIEAERERARTDALTGLLNRRGAEEALAQEHLRLGRSGETAAVVLVDLDRFHWINHTYDMAGGDLVLRELCRRVKRELRRSDLVGRWGGEELLVIAPNLDPAALPVFAEKLRRLVRDTPVEIGSDQLTVTCSVGAAMLDPSAAPEVSIQRANRALSRAKERRDTACTDSTSKAARTLHRETQVDALTGLLTWQALAAFVLPREIERALETGQPLALLRIDVDQLKKINDLFGHRLGDVVLAGVADSIVGVVGREELVFRIGGDEFAVLLPLPGEQALEAAEQILRNIARRSFADEAEMPASLARVTASIGLTTLPSDTPAGAEADLLAHTLLSGAEDAMLDAKTRGGDRIASTAYDAAPSTGHAV